MIRRLPIPMDAKLLATDADDAQQAVIQLV